MGNTNTHESSIKDDSLKKPRRTLSKYGEGNCIKCYTEIILSLGHRRGEFDIECPDCESCFNIDELEKFMKKLSNITEGDCPNCRSTLVFNAKERLAEQKIKCPECMEYFYLDEVEEPITQKTRNNTLPRNKIENLNNKKDVPKKNPLDYYILAWKKYGQFDGRSNRAEFWWFHFFDFLVFPFLAILAEMDMFFNTLYILYFLASILPRITVGVRRMHDVGSSGIMLIVPLINLIYSITEGDKGKNQYGDEPE